GREHLAAHRTHARGDQVPGVRVRAEQDRAGANRTSGGARLAARDALDARVLVDARAGARGRVRETAHPLHWMEVAVVGVRRRARARIDADPCVVRREAARALGDLAPLRFIARDLVRAVPAQLAFDAVTRHERAHELVRALREAPDAQRLVVAVTARRGDEVLGHAGEEEARVAPARRFGDAARFQHQDARAGGREEVRARDPRDAAADDRDVGGGVALQGRIGALDAVEPEAHRASLSLT